jgi:hypothetical protein
MSNITLEDGCIYKQRNGIIVGPVKRTNDIQWPFWIPTLNFRPYRKDGRTCLSGWIDKDEDLVEKVTNE